MASSDDKVLTFVVETERTVYPVKAATKIFLGRFVGEDGSGDSRPLVAGDKFQGISLEHVDNTSGLAGAKTVEVKKKCRIIYDVEFVTSKTVNDRQLVYASGDDTLTLTSSGNSLVGSIIRWISGTSCEIQIEA